MVSCNKKLGRDAISSLPCDIIASILGRLSLTAAVRTSILSREWRYKWTSIPNLVFDFLCDRAFFGNSELENIINLVLHHHGGPINKFSLICRTSPVIDQWILLLLSSKVEHFTLRIFLGARHEIASPFFSLQHLKHLCLSRCVFEPPPEFKGFSKLVTLDFHEVEYVPTIVEQFISRCPLLERLWLVRCTNLNAFVLQGPSLRFFSFYGVFKTICFKKSPLLDDVSLYVPRFPNLGIPSSTGFNYFHIPPTLEKLHLHPCLLDFSGAGGVPNRFTDGLNSLKVLDLTMNLDSVTEVACAFCLARSSPNLQMLSITLYSSRFGNSITEFIRDQETPDPYLDQLRTVKIANFSWHHPEIELLRYLLASTSGLEEMVIAPYCGNLIDRIMQFPRASPTARVFVSKGKV